MRRAHQKLLRPVPVTAIFLAVQDVILYVVPPWVTKPNLRSRGNGTVFLHEMTRK